MYETQCSQCGSQVYVVEATIVVTGQRMIFRSRLEEDGFIVPIGDLEIDPSTQDEIVECGSCHFREPLRVIDG